ncbi:MAG TPA: hypothetical protein VN577_06955 [Terriglobales bacterium]|nr:hypothetical protein [Terriglobales bacterium]
MRICVIVTALVFSVSLLSCSRKNADVPAPATSEATVSEEPTSVELDITPEGKQTDDHWRYRATYTKNGQTAKFIIDMKVSNSNADQVPGRGDFKIKSGRGSFVADPTSQNAALLDDLKQALMATTMPSHKIRVRELPFEFVSLGENLTRDRNGGLADTNQGKWVGAKIFLGAGDDESEVFFNFEKGGGKAEFSLKDEEYGNGVLNELAKVL